MSNKPALVLKPTLLLAATLVAFTLPASGQELPDGPGKELAVANCNICHTLMSRVGAGYTPEGWDTVLHMMHNQGAPSRRTRSSR